MNNWMGKLSRKGIILLAVAAILLFSGVAYGANLLVVSFQGGLGVTGTVKVVAPDPTLADVVVVSVPDFTITAGVSSNATGYITVRNDSAYNLTLQSATFTLDESVGYISYVNLTPLLPAKGQHTLKVILYYYPLVVGDFQYSGDLTYSW